MNDIYKLIYNCRCSHRRRNPNFLCSWFENSETKEEKKNVSFQEAMLL